MSLPKDGLPASQSPTLGGWPELDELLLFAADQLRTDVQQLARAVAADPIDFDAGPPLPTHASRS